MIATQRARGFTYVGLLIVIALIGIALAAGGELASTRAKRDREAQLLFVGDQIATAIAQYRASSPGVAQDPPSLEHLLADPRYPNTRRYLRRIYPDPMTGKPDWGFVRGATGGIGGVFSRAEGTPLKIDGFPEVYASFAGSQKYSSWRFVRTSAGGGQGGSPAPGGASAPGQQPGGMTPFSPSGSAFPTSPADGALGPSAPGGLTPFSPRGGGFGQSPQGANPSPLQQRGSPFSSPDAPAPSSPFSSGDSPG